MAVRIAPAVAVLRRAVPGLVVAAVVLFVLTLAQTGIGHLITGHGDDGWIADPGRDRAEQAFRPVPDTWAGFRRDRK